MIKNRIQFQRAHSLHIDPDLDRYISPMRDELLLAGIFRKWKGNSIQDIFVFAGANANGPLHSFTRLLAAEGFRIHLVSDQFILENQYDTYRRHNIRILKSLKEGPALVLFSRDCTPHMTGYLATILITPPKSRIEPNEALRILTGDNHILPQDFRIYEFKKYIQPDYQVPPLLRDKMEQLYRGPSETVSREPVSPTSSYEKYGGPLPSGSGERNGHHGTIPSAPARAVALAQDMAIAVEEAGARATLRESPAIEASFAAPAAPVAPPAAPEISEIPEIRKEVHETLEKTEERAIEELEEIPLSREKTPPDASLIPSPITPTVIASPVTLPEKIEGRPEIPAVVEEKREAQAVHALLPEEIPGEAERAGGARFSLKVKLISIISAILLAALSVMIFLASYYFRNESEVRIQENNLGLTSVIAQRVESELKSDSYKARFLSDQMQNRSESVAVFERFKLRFFKENNDFVYVGIASRKGEQLVMDREEFNDQFLDENGLRRENFADTNRMNRESFLPSFSGAMVVQNASPGSPIPLLGLSFPVSEGVSDKIIVAYLNPVGILKAFQPAGGESITTTFMVNGRGEVIAHPDSRLVLSRTSLADLPIVREMMKSPIDNGQSRFKDAKGIYHLGSFKKLEIAGLGIITTVPENLVFAEVYDIQRRNLYIMGLVLILAVVIIFFFSRTLSIPIVKLVGATQKVEQGNYHVDIVPSTRDEVGILTSSFLKMARGLEEREKMKDAFGKFVNKEIAERVLRGELSLGGERKEVAIFFSDLRGFTAMSEGMEPEEVVEFLNEYFTVMVDCVNRTHGVVDKFIGDAIMAHWGALVSHGNNTENAVTAAVMMRKALIEFNARPLLNGKPKPQAKTGCGINTGPVISGQIGSEERLEFTVIGDAVNLASRIEALNKPFYCDVLISQDSYDQVKDIFRVEKMPAIRVKGKAEPQTIYAVLGRFDDPECPGSMDEVRKMVGIVVDEKKAHSLSKGVLEDDDKEVKYEIIEG